MAKTNKNHIFSDPRLSVATIKGLAEKPYYSKEKLFYGWDILFEDHPFGYGNLVLLYMGKTEEEANETYDTFFNRFKSLGINEGDDVCVLSDKGEVVAIAKPGVYKWIHVRDKFRIKSWAALKYDEFIIKYNGFRNRQ